MASPAGLRGSRRGAALVASLLLLGAAPFLAELSGAALEAPPRMVQETNGTAAPGDTSSPAGGGPPRESLTRLLAEQGAGVVGALLRHESPRPQLSYFVSGTTMFLAFCAILLLAQYRAVASLARAWTHVFTWIFDALVGLALVLAWALLALAGGFASGLALTYLVLRHREGKLLSWVPADGAAGPAPEEPQGPPPSPPT